MARIVLVALLAAIATAVSDMGPLLPVNYEEADAVCVLEPTEQMNSSFTGMFALAEVNPGDPNSSLAVSFTLEGAICCCSFVPHW